MRKSTVAASILSLALVWMPAVTAQEGGMVRVITTHVQLGHQRHYETLIPKLWDALKKAGGSTPVFVAAGASDPGAYTFVVPMQSLAEFDAQETALGKAFAAAPELTAELFGITTSIDDEIWRDRPDLAFVPASPRLRMEEQGFMRVALLYAHPGQVLAVEEVLKERAALLKKHGIADGYGVAQLVIGADGPVYALLVGAKDEADFYAENARQLQKMGAEWQAYREKAGPLLRRVEFVSSSARPQLTYQP